MRAAETAARLRGTVGGAKAVDRAVNGLGRPLLGATRGTAALAIEVVAVGAGRKGVSPRAMTALLWHRPGPGVSPRVMGFSIGSDPSLPAPARAKR